MYVPIYVLKNRYDCTTKTTMYYSTLRYARLSFLTRAKIYKNFCRVTTCLLNCEYVVSTNISNFSNYDVNTVQTSDKFNDTRV